MHRPPHPLRRLLTVLALVTASLWSCTRVEIEVLDSGQPLSEADTATVAMHLSPEWLAAADRGPLDAAIREQLRLQWQASKVITHTLADGTEVLLPDLTADLEAQALSIQAVDDHLQVDGTFATEPMRVSLRFKQSAGDTFCRVDLDLGARELSFDVMPSVDDGVIAWPTQLRAGLTTEAPLSWAAAEACPIDLQTVNWSLVDSLVDADLTAQASSTFVPAVRDLVVAQLALPRAGLELRSVQSGFYAPLPVTLSTRATSTPPWVGGGIEVEESTGLRVALDTHLEARTARCAADLDALAPRNAPRALRPHGTPDKAPTTGEDWAAALVIDQGFADDLLLQLARAGHLCGDLDAPQSGGLPRLEVLVEELQGGGELDFERDARVRIQPTGAPSLERVDTDTVRVTLDGLRLEVYGEAVEDDRTVDGLLVRLARLEGRFVIEGRPVIDDSGAITLDDLEVTAQLRDSDVTALESTGATVDAELLAARVVTLLARHVVRLPMPRPFGRELELIELDDRDGALWIYLGWR